MWDKNELIHHCEICIKMREAKEGQNVQRKVGLKLVKSVTSLEKSVIGIEDNRL